MEWNVSKERVRNFQDKGVCRCASGHSRSLEALAQERGTEKGSDGSPLLSHSLSLSLSLVGQPTHRIYARGKRGPERMGSLWRKAGVPHPEFIGTTRGGRLGERGSWACVSVSVSRECVGS